MPFRLKLAQVLSASVRRNRTFCTMGSIDYAMRDLDEPTMASGAVEAIVGTELDDAIRAVVEVTAAPPRTQVPKPCKSNCAKVLLSMFGWGFITATIVQRIAAAVVEDFKDVGVEAPQSLLELSQIGAGGEHKQNCRRDLWRWLEPKLRSIPSPICIRIPFLKARSITRHLVEYMDLEIMMPNLLIEVLYNDFPDIFRKMLGGGLERFWSQVPE